ncbi:hypothetical protein N7492_009872 [Penicillium capsulatum]|uniref:FAD dependent oxidoreductase domain-containing protein n=1 Tax=Penicillium capsulatum TaxID=69766 RepID=A0A9W9HLC7_9EURO|nr:hypothetical protein N7492_009872 [Penicillium capsulatum]KAJ6112383.1 hypothetical protein N7512_007707 [Penicillium capsulatum]
MAPDRDLVTSLVLADPGLPRQTPTESYWQHIPHPLAETQSASLPAETDHAIIGSGITGLAVAKTLLEQHATATVTVLEARTLCSGATGRNGGQMAANAGEEYMHLAETHGAAIAGQIVSFTLRNLDQMHVLMEDYDAVETCEMQRVQKLRVFLTDDKFHAFQESIARLETDHPSLRGLYTILDRDVVLQKYKIHGAAGGALLPAATIWPYRLITKVFAALIEKYPRRLTIETQTPVESIQHESNKSVFPYTLHTSRGLLRAGNVVHCTNGYSGHLLPNLRGRIHPFKGTMTVQDPKDTVPNQGTSLSWGFHYSPTYDSVTERRGYGLYYLGQSVRTGYFYFGGEESRLEDVVSADDSWVGEYSVGHLQSVLPGFFGQGSSWDVVSAWSGIMGFSSDGLPLVGRLPTTLTGREGNGEWIAAAFNGYGMANCLLSGEALARSILGENKVDLPEAYGVGEKRLSQFLTASEAIKAWSKL